MLPPDGSLPDAELTGRQPLVDHRGRRVEERFLAYQPQGGVSNQLVALTHAAAWAVVLGRTLVLPHFLPHLDITRSNDSTAYLGQPPSLNVDELPPFERFFAASPVAGLRTVPITELLQRGLRPSVMVTLTSFRFRFFSRRVSPRLVMHGSPSRLSETM